MSAFELLGDPDAQACEGDVCVVPTAPEPVDGGTPQPPEAAAPDEA